MSKQRNDVEARIGNFLNPGRSAAVGEQVEEVEPTPVAVTMDERRPVRVVPNRTERIERSPQPPSNSYQRTNVLVRPEFYRKLKKQAVELDVPMYELMDRAFAQFLKDLN